MKKIQKENQKENKNKKRLLVVGTLGALTVLGGTLAYFTTSTNIVNNFKAGLYQNKIVEVFESPSNWTPGTTTSKTIAVTNTGSIPMAVRATYTEKWVSANGNELSLKDSKNNIAAIINFGSGWAKDADGYYYYGTKENKTSLASEATSTSFIQSVKFNNNIEATLEEIVSEDGKTITYTSTGDGYDNATYTLTVKLETVQYDQANNLWK